MRWAGIWLVAIVTVITALILDRFGRSFRYGLVVTLSRSSLTSSYIAEHINEVSRHLIGQYCERDNLFNSWLIWTKLQIWPCCDIVSVMFDSQQFLRILMRWAGIWLIDVVNTITPLILDQFGWNFRYGLVLTLSRSSSTDSNFCAY
jgi:hypothetical protein